VLVCGFVCEGWRGGGVIALECDYDRTQRGGKGIRKGVYERIGPLCLLWAVFGGAERGVHYIPAPPRPVDIFTSLSAKFECLRAMNGPVRGTGNANQQSFQQGI